MERWRRAMALFALLAARRPRPAARRALRSAGQRGAAVDERERGWERRIRSRAQRRAARGGEDDGSLKVWAGGRESVWDGVTGLPPCDYGEGEAGYYGYDVPHAEPRGFCG